MERFSKIHLSSVLFCFVLFSGFFVFIFCPYPLSAYLLSLIIYFLLLWIFKSMKWCPISHILVVFLYCLSSDHLDVPGCFSPLSHSFPSLTVRLLSYRHLAEEVYLKFSWGTSFKNWTLLTYWQFLSNICVMLISGFALVVVN